MAQVRGITQAANYHAAVQYEQAWLSLFNSTTYSSRIFPLGGGYNASVLVRVQFLLLSLISLTTDKTLSIAARIHLEWFDPNLGCAYRKCFDDNHRSFPANLSLLWTPQLALSDAASGIVYLHYRPIARIVPQARGSRIFAQITQQMVTNCDTMNITYFPYDLQNCTIKIISDGIGSENLIFDSFPNFRNNASLIVSSSASSSEWRITGSSMSFTQADESSPPSFQVQLTLKRHSYYYQMILLVPAAVIGGLVLCVFILPFESGEKIGLSSTLVLAMFVFQQMFSTIVPQFDPDETPLVFSALQTAFYLCAVALGESVVIEALAYISPGLAYRMECKLGRFVDRFFKTASNRTNCAPETQEMSEMGGLGVDCSSKTTLTSEPVAFEDRLNVSLIALIEDISKVMRDWRLQRERKRREEVYRDQERRAWLRFQYFASLLCLLFYVIYYLAIAVQVQRKMSA